MGTSIITAFGSYALWHLPLTLHGITHTSPWPQAQTLFPACNNFNGFATKSTNCLTLPSMVRLVYIFLFFSHFHSLPLYFYTVIHFNPLLLYFNHLHFFFFSFFLTLSFIELNRIQGRNIFPWKKKKNLPYSPNLPDQWAFPSHLQWTGIFGILNKTPPSGSRPMPLLREGEEERRAVGVHPLAVGTALSVWDWHGPRSFVIFDYNSVRYFRFCRTA